ncbi:hypothetical protein [Streptomyces sp. NPDC047061]|uniref:hypothetical protein n=1 Tax=Streptomyces sp. NPDC047061 TaxID=3154605 RepID=UPI0033C889C9
MNRWIRRVSIAVASTALAGGALLGTGSSASAATSSGPAEHPRPAITAFTTGNDRDGHDSRDGHRDDQSYRDERYDRNDHRTQEERSNDRHPYAQDAAHHRAEATTWYGVDRDRWYLDQLAWYQQP